MNRALEEFVRRIKAGRILELRGSDLWQGELAEMRRDRHTGDQQTNSVAEP